MVASNDPAESAATPIVAGEFEGKTPMFTSLERPADFPFEDIRGVGDENKIRGNWSSSVDFILSSFGFTVGLANLWRFPYYCYTNGGGTFVIAYIIMLIVVGVPIFFMELALGQFASLGCISVWKVCPLFKGIGIAMFLVSFLIAIYYNIVTSWSIYYLISSVRLGPLPWTSCNNGWNTQNCSTYSRKALEFCHQNNGSMLSNGTCIEKIVANTIAQGLLATDKFQEGKTLPSDEYFHNQVLKISSGIDDIGTINWQLVLYLLAAWIMVFFSLFKGVKSSGKIVYLTVIAPYIILLVLLVRALTLDGSKEGLLYFLTPQVGKLLDPTVWAHAASQVFFSLCLCWGGITTLASYNKFHNNCLRDTWIICLGDALSSIFAGMVTFSTLGYMAHHVGKTLDQVVVQGPGLPFVVYAEALSHLPIAPFWSVLFFLMLIMLGIDTQFYIVETIVTAICDGFPEMLRKSSRHVLLVVCFLFYAMGVPLCTQAGIYIFQLMDYFVINWSLLIIGFFECVVIAWVYGTENFMDNINWMLRKYPTPYIGWVFCWKFITPIVLIILLAFAWFDYSPVTYGAYEYPYWALMAGWCVSFISVCAIPLWALWKICCGRRLQGSKGFCCQHFRDSMFPAEDWGPALAIHRAEHFPLQIPETKRPQFFLSGSQAPESVVDGEGTPLTAIGEESSQSQSEEQDRKTEDADRETTI